MGQLSKTVRTQKGVTGLVVVHSAPSALRSHIEWALHNAIGQPISLRWNTQPHCAGTYRTVLRYRDRKGLATSIVSALRSWHYLRFEVSEIDEEGGELFRFTPDLGLHRADIDGSGAILVRENLIESALRSSFDEESLRLALESALGKEWDEELEIYRGVELQEVERLRAI